MSTVVAAQTPKATISESTRVNNDSSESRWHGLPTVAVDPANPRHVVVTERHQHSDGSVDCTAHTSYDAMASFTHAAIPAPHACAAYNSRGRVHVAIGSESRAYFLVADVGRSSLVPSTDGGMTFNEPVTVDPKNGDFDRMAIRVTQDAPDSIYVVRRGTSSSGNVRVATVSVSTDNGASFSPSVEVSDLNKALSTTENIRIAAGPEAGRLYVTYAEARPAPAGAPPGTSAFPGKLHLTRSDDDGATWGKPSVEIPTGIDKAPSPELHNYWSNLAVDPNNGTLFVTWSDERNGDADIFLIRSSDGGETWQPVQRLSHDEVGSGRYQYRGSIGVAPNGRVDVAYYDSLNTCPKEDFPCYDTRVFLRSSGDGGSTFGDAQLLTEQPFDHRLKRATWANGDQLDVNTSVASVNELAYIAWLDTRLGTPENNNRDIAAARAQFSPFIRLRPPPRYDVVAVIEVVDPPAPASPSTPVVAAQSPLPPPPPAPPAAPPMPAPPPAPAAPIPPAAPIVPAQPAAMLQAQLQAQALGVGAVIPTPAGEVAPIPQPRWQGATASWGGGPLLFYGSATLLAIVALALSLAVLTRAGQPRAIPARQRSLV